MSRYRTHIFTQQKRLKKHLRDKYDLSWTEYLVLCSAYEIDETYGFATTTKIIAELELNRDWVYQAVKRLSSKDYLDITKTMNPWLPNYLNLTFRGKILLSSIERLVGERVFN